MVSSSKGFLATLGGNSYLSREINAFMDRSYGPMDRERSHEVTQPGRGGASSGGRDAGRRPPVVLVGFDELIGVQMARIFARRGIRVIGITKRPEHYACRTRYVRELVVANTYGDEVVPALVALGKTLEEKAVLVPCIDETVLRVSRNRADLDPYYIYNLPDPETVETLTDKVGFFRFAQREALPIPQTFLISDAAGAREAANGIRYPCILKPHLKSPRWWDAFGQKAIMARTPGELADIWERVAGFMDMVIAQEYVRGGEGNHYTVNSYYDRGGELRVTFVSRKIRQWPPLTGYGTISEECRNDAALEQSTMLFARIPYRGFGYIEVKQDEETGEHKILEANIGRPTGRSSMAEAAGVELHYTMYCDVVGLPLPENLVQTYRGVKWIQAVNDCRSAWYFWRRGKLTVAEYIRTVRGKKCFAIWSLSDPMPFIADLWAKFTNTIKMKIHLAKDKRIQLP